MMNDTSKVAVSIGMPVYNGENFIAAAIESILSQTFDDFELVISDNASTDATESICRHYQSMDSRIRYSRNEKNLGSAENYRKVFRESKGHYFKWAAHDDLCKPLFLEKCVDVLDNNPSVVLCYTKSDWIDENGNEIINNWAHRNSNYSFPRASRRLTQLLLRPTNVVETIFGLMRSDVLRKTPLLSNHEMHDWILLAELILYGPFYKVSDVLFSWRRHDAQYSFGHKSGHNKEGLSWFDSNVDTASTMYAPFMRRSREHFSSCYRVPLSYDEKVLCTLVVLPGC